MQELQQQLDQKTAQLTALREISQAINAAWKLEATLELITRKTAEVMAMDSCSIYLLDAEGERLVLQATTGLATTAIGRAHLRVGEGLTGWAAHSGEALAVADAAKDPRFKYLPETEESIFQSLLAVPLINQGRVIGAMNVQTRAYHQHRADEVELLSLIGDLAAGALEKALLYERMQRQITELSTLAEVSEAVTSPLYLHEMLGLIVDMAAQVMRAKACSLLLLEERRNQLVLEATQGFSSAYNQKPPLELGEGVAGQVVQTGEPMIIEDVRQDRRYHYAEIARQEHLCSLLCVPLHVRESVIGVLNCYTGEPHTFTSQEIELFQTLANQTALAIENSHLVVNTAIVREMHHRVKNNLQTIAMLLRLQLREGPQIDAQEALYKSISRILSMAAVHEALSEKGFRLADAKGVLRQVAQIMGQHLPHPNQEVTIEVRGDEVSLPSRTATALALVVNELVQNGLKHAFVGREKGHIIITLRNQPPGFEVEVQDDGVGLSADQPPPNSLGLQIINTLVSQDLGGRLDVERSEQGTRAIVSVPGSANPQPEYSKEQS